MRALIAALAFVALPVSAASLIADVSAARANLCVLTRSGVESTSPVVVDIVNGLPANGHRVCKIALTPAQMTGTVSLALRDSAIGDTGPSVDYTFPAPAPLPAPGNVRVK